MRLATSAEMAAVRWLFALVVAWGLAVVATSGSMGPLRAIRAAEAPANQTPATQAPPGPASGYAGSDTRLTRHSDMETTLNGTRHARTRDQRTAALSNVYELALDPAGIRQDAAVEKGKAVYAAQKCSMCHGIAGAGAKTSALDGVGKKLSAADIRSWIVTPKEMEKKSGSTKKPSMPDRYARLPPADLDALVAYLSSLK